MGSGESWPCLLLLWSFQSGFQGKCQIHREIGAGGVRVLFLCIYLLYKTNIQTGVSELGLEAQEGAQQARVGVRIQIASALQQVLVEDLKNYCLKVETSRSWE